MKHFRKNFRQICPGQTSLDSYKIMNAI